MEAEVRTSNGRAVPCKFHNQLFLLADKVNDLPPWFHTSCPQVKNIHIPHPDFRMRQDIIDCISGGLSGYKEACTEDRRRYIERFVGLTDGLMTREILNIRSIMRMYELSITDIERAAMIYRHGIQENPWLKLDRCDIQRAKELLSRNIMGQDAVLTSAVDIIKRAVMGMSGIQQSRNSTRPKGVMFLAGPTGTGKTELAKRITELLFKDARNMIRFDMSEYREAHSDQRLLGAPPGYVGYEAGGQLTNAVREHPFSVLLFDEIEKADPTLLDKFLQILDDGRITDGRGETVYFQNCLIIFTSNLGMTDRSAKRNGTLPVNLSYEQDISYEALVEKVKAGIRAFFVDEINRPELLNRIGENILVFNFIREDVARQIMDKQIDDIAATLWEEKQIRLSVPGKPREQLFAFVRAGLTNAQGGRGVGNCIEQNFVNPLARYLFDSNIHGNAEVIVEEIISDGSQTIIRGR